jgi:hypothetical protein
MDMPGICWEGTFVCPVLRQAKIWFGKLENYLYFSSHYTRKKLSREVWWSWQRKNSHGFHSFIPLACAECDDSLLFSWSSSIPLCYVLFPTTLLHQLFVHPLSPHRAVYFLVYLSIFLFPNSYVMDVKIQLKNSLPCSYNPDLNKPG